MQFEMQVLHTPLAGDAAEIMDKKSAYVNRTLLREMVRHSKGQASQASTAVVLGGGQWHGIHLHELTDGL